MSYNPPAALPSGIDDRTVFRTLFAAYPDSLLVVDQAGRIVLANPSAAALLGYAPEELVGLPVDALVPDSIRPRHASYREAYGHAPRPRPMGTQMDLVARRKDGSEVMVEIALSPLQNEGLPFIVAAIRDIGEYPRVKQALQRARYSEHLAQLGRLAVDERNPQVLLDRVPALAAEALQAEAALVTLLESSRLETRIAAAFGLEPGRDIAAREPLRADSPAGWVLTEGRPLVVADASREPRFAAAPVYRSAGMVSSLVAPVLDRGRSIGALAVHSRKAQRFGDEETRFLESMASLLATTLQRAQSEEALNHAQRLESVGQLTGGIAHDFNNLLTVIQGNLQVLEELPALQADAYGQQLVGAAGRATRRAAELTSKLLTFSRRQVLQPTRVDAGALLQSLADMLRRTLDQRIRIEVEAQDCPPVVADPGQLEAALLNIAINARDAMPNGGSLHFRSESTQTPPPELRRDGESHGAARFVAITIADTGTGMSPEVKERAFEPFFTTKQAGRGTGLGLSTVYGFVKQSKGAVEIASTPGVGTAVTLFIPQHVESKAAAVDNNGADDQVPHGLRVLLVEDDADVRNVIYTFLAQLQCEVVTAISGEQALLELTPPARFDLLLTDIALGTGLRGTQLAAQARERFPELAVLLMSGFSAELLEADRDCPPDWELLRKPYGKADLARAIAKVIGGRPPA